VVKYTIILERSSFFYTWLSVIPGIVITVLSFAVFWADTESADALGFGITVIVVNLLSNLVLVNMLPVCGEMIWIDLYAAVNTLFCCLSLFQSAFNIMLENHTGDYLLPIWLALPIEKFSNWICGRHNRYEQSDLLVSASAIRESVAGVIFRQQEQIALDDEPNHSPLPSPPDSPVDVDAHASDDATDVRGCGNRFSRHHSKSLFKAAKTTRAERAKKLVFFERLFFLLDEDASLFVERAECDSLLSYASLHTGPLQRQKLFDNYDTMKDGRLNRIEFVQLCCDELWDVDIPTLEMAVDNMRKARDSRKTRNAARWTRVANQADQYARCGIPALYVACLIVIFNLDLSDDYSNPDVEMFWGLGPAHLTVTGSIMITCYISILLIIFGMWFKMTRLARAQITKQEREFKKASLTAVHKATFEHVGSLGKLAATEWKKGVTSIGDAMGKVRRKSFAPPPSMPSPSETSATSAQSRFGMDTTAVKDVGAELYVIRPLRKQKSASFSNESPVVIDPRLVVVQRG